jgi:hypothetical protein
MAAITAQTARKLRYAKASIAPALSLVRMPSKSFGVVPPPVEKALSLLRATSFSDEKKQPVFDADVLGAMRGMFAASKQYKFDLFANTSVGTGSSADILTTLSISPAVVSYSEWSLLAALFDEVKLVRAMLEFIPMVGSDGQSFTTSTSTKVMLSAMVCGANHDNISTLPASYAAVGRLAKSTTVVRCCGDRSGAYTIFLSPSPGLGWARTATPAVLDPPAGCIGSFDLASDPSSNLSTTTIYYKNILRLCVILRNRN